MGDAMVRPWRVGRAHIELIVDHHQAWRHLHTRVAEEVVEDGVEESDGPEITTGEMTGRQTVGVGEEEGEEEVEAGPGGEEVSVSEELTTGTETRNELNTLSEK